jgi:hypothetical protein
MTLPRTTDSLGADTPEEHGADLVHGTVIRNLASRP